MQRDAAPAGAAVMRGSGPKSGTQKEVAYDAKT